MRLILIGTALSMSLIAQAALAMSGPDITNLITDKKVTLKTSYGKFPLRYRSDSTVLGDGSKTGLVRFFAPKETGKWWVNKNSLCQQWPTWYKGKVFCFEITKLSNSQIKWERDDGFSGTAVISD